VPWDEERAAETAEQFYAFLTQLEREYPDAVRRLRERWKTDYLVSGHKRLGRIVLGNTPEQANRQRGRD
jgi:hypothetical protein